MNLVNLGDGRGGLGSTLSGDVGGVGGISSGNAENVGVPGVPVSCVDVTSRQEKLRESGRSGSGRKKVRDHVDHLRLIRTFLVVIKRNLTLTGVIYLLRSAIARTKGLRGSKAEISEHRGRPSPRRMIKLSR